VKHFWPEIKILSMSGDSHPAEKMPLGSRQQAREKLDNDTLNYYTLSMLNQDLLLGAGILTNGE
jgi:hypothetical protein